MCQAKLLIRMEQAEVREMEVELKSGEEAAATAFAEALAQEFNLTPEPKSKAQCYAEMRKAAQDEYAKGCDLPTITLKVDFVNCSDAEEYRQYAALTDIFLGDSVRVIARRIGVERWWLILGVALVAAALGALVILTEFRDIAIVSRLIGANLAVDGVLNLYVTQSTVNTIRRKKVWEA